MGQKTLLTLAALLLLAVGAAREAGAVYLDGEPTRAVQPNGAAVAAVIVGDEFYSRLESPEGYTLVRDEASGYYCYAELSADGARLLSTGVHAGTPPPLRLELHLDIKADARRAIASEARAAVMASGGFGDRYLPPDMAPHSGQVVGITVLVDFTDQSWPVDRDLIEDLLNEPGFSAFGTLGSVRDYFLHVSGGQLDYSNVVSDGYITADSTWAYWATRSMTYTNQLVTEVLQKLDVSGFDFSQYDVDADGYIDAINILTEGPPSSGNTVLHGHASWDLNLQLDGLTAGYYQILNIGPNLPHLGSFCHENGHMLCGWPDLYDTGGAEEGILGGFCLMSANGGGYRTARQPIAYLKERAGWLSPIALGDRAALYKAKTDANVAFKISHPDPMRPEEFYIIENRQAVGYDQGLPDTGLAIYHIDESRFDNSDYAIDLVEADGQWSGIGGPGDLWKAPTYTTFNFSTATPAIWYDGEVPGLSVYNISGDQSTMSFWFTRYDRYRIAIDPQPASIAAPWQLSGPGTFGMSGNGYQEIDLPCMFSYTVDFLEVPYWSGPTPASITRQLWTEPTQPIPFATTYTSPFGLVTGGPLANTGSAACANAIDRDGDGVDEIFVGNLDGPSQLLDYQGNGVFADVAPPELASIQGVKNAAWADTDNDGDEDVFLVRGTNQHLLLEQSATSFVDVTWRTPEFSQIGEAETASWNDVGRDGLLDLFLVRHTTSNLLFDGMGGNVFTPGLLGWYAGGGLNSQSISWGDYNLDGYMDAFLTGIGAGTANRGVVWNNGGVLSHPGSAHIQCFDSKDACWADLNNDGLLDLVLLGGHANNAVYMQVAPAEFELWVSSGVGQLGGVGSSILADDFDNDGLIDLFVTSAGGEDFFAFSTGDFSDYHARFTQVHCGYAEAAGPSRVAVACDYDGDGGLDLFVGQDGEPNFVLRNELADRGHWLNVRLTGDAMNRDAIGATVVVQAGGRSMLRQTAAGGSPGQQSLTLHFGLGAAQVADLVTIRWMGSTEVTYLANVAADQRIDVTQPAGGQGKREVSEAALTTSFAPAYPNPFNPKTTLNFTLATAAEVNVSIYAVDGRRVVELVDEPMAAGPHSVTWTGLNAAGNKVASGTYLCRIKAGDQEHTSRLMLLK